MDLQPCPIEGCTAFGHHYQADFTREQTSFAAAGPAAPKDNVNHPNHYTWLKDRAGVEVIDVLEAAFPKEPLLWQVGKYLFRYGHKGEDLEQLEKAEFYLSRRIQQLKEAKGRQP